MAEPAPFSRWMRVLFERSNASRGAHLPTPARRQSAPWRSRSREPPQASGNDQLPAQGQPQGSSGGGRPSASSDSLMENVEQQTSAASRLAEPLPPIQCVSSRHFKG